MKTAALFLIPLFLAGGFLLAGEPPEDPEACNFKVKGEPTRPMVTGPEETVPLVHVIEQPDSPVGIISVDFEGSFLWIRDEQFTWEPHCKTRIRNRSDQVVLDVEVGEALLDNSGGVGSAGHLPQDHLSGLAPGEELELRACGGKGFGGAKNNQVRILVGIHWVQLKGCRYYPSARLPDRLGVAPSGWRP